MAIDIDAIKRKLEGLTTQKKRNLWKPEAGKEYVIRMLPFSNDDGSPFKELWFYYNIGDNPGLLAPYQFGKDDPIKELADRLKKGSKDEFEVARKLFPKMRSFVPVIVRGEEDKGVRVWGFSKTVYQKLLTLLLDSDWGDITDPVNGRDVKVTCVQTPGKDFADVDVFPKPSITPLSKDKAVAQKWLSDIPDITEVFPVKSYSELSAIVEKWLSGSKDVSVDDSASIDKSERRGGTLEERKAALDKAFSSLEG